MAENILLLINSEGDQKNINYIKNYFESNYHELIEKGNLLIKESEDENSIKTYAQKFSYASKKNIIIIVGGDGSVHELINSISFKNTSICILPNGTGNDFAHHIYGDKKIEEILEKLDLTISSKIDLIKANDRYCINVLSYGYDSIVLEKAMELRKKYKFIRSISYILAIPFTIHKVKPINYRYELITRSGQIISGNGEFLLTAICNGRFFGKGFQPAPAAKINDSILTFNHIENMSLPRLIRNISKLKNGRHVNEVKESHSFDIISGTLKGIDGKFIGNMDGELYEFDKINFKIKHEILNLIGIDYK